MGGGRWEVGVGRGSGRWEEVGGGTWEVGGRRKEAEAGGGPAGGGGGRWEVGVLLKRPWYVYTHLISDPMMLHVRPTTTRAKDRKD